MFDTGLLFSLILATLFLGLLLLLVINYFSRPVYAKRRLLTKPEYFFYFALLEATENQYLVFPQVRLANVVRLKNKVFLWEHFNPLGGKCVDFVLCNKSDGEIALVIELDDKSHRTLKVKKRDRFVNDVLKKAGVPILHQKSLDHYNVVKLKTKIAAKAIPDSILL